jgi:ubiquinone/menaquinone biosynthesis C-methylase UbiE
MPDDRKPTAMQEHCARGLELERLAESTGRLEFERTKEIILRHLPPPPAVVADIGGGPGRYALWVGQLGYQILHRDLMPLHVEQLRQAANGNSHIQTALGDARQLDLASDCADAVLLLGPLYHLEHRKDRLQALAEVRRVVHPGGPVFVAAISRWATRMDGILRLRLYESIPGAEAKLSAI